jgi:hypothetical protein
MSRTNTGAVKKGVPAFIAVFICHIAAAQVLQQGKDSLVLSNPLLSVSVSQHTGKVSYRFTNGTTLANTIAYVEDLHTGYLSSTDFTRHEYTLDTLDDPLGKSICVNITHEDDKHSIRLVQHITVYEAQPFVLISTEAETKNEQGQPVETRNISPIAILPAQGGRCSIPGAAARFLDVPFDNDNWVKTIAQPWPTEKGESLTGISYEFASVYDQDKLSGFVIGSLTHDCWKTGIRYTAGVANGVVDSLIVYGGAATKDNPSLPAAHGGYDGTHDYVPHGSVKGGTVRSPLIFLSAATDIRKVFVNYGQINTTVAGRSTWKGYAPFYWNSFGVEGVLGYEKVMMPAGMVKIVDFIHTLDHFNQYAQPVLSIDSYDQGIYNTEMLASISKYGKKKNQQMGFYFIPFAIWTWKNSLDNKLQGTDYTMKDVILKDNEGNPIPYKNGDWAAYPLDPTHPATRAYIIYQLQRAKAIDARFIKIDFLSAGSLESPVHYDPAITTGMQAYNKGMKMLRSLVDSIVGKDIFITMAISPMFPHQYAHTRFVSTDVYSHLRDDQPGFPGWGSTSSSMITASHMWWVQGTLWPYTNMDVAIMKNFQKQPALNEQEIKVRLYSMITLGSIFGDGSDFRDKIAAERAAKFLNNAAICAFFSQPKAFTPIKFSEGESLSQQISFYLPGDTTLLSVFNFDTQKDFTETFYPGQIGLKDGKYQLVDFLTNEVVGKLEKGQASFNLTVHPKDALLVKLLPVHE